MIGEPDPSAEADIVETPEDAELGRALEVYLADIEAGRPADPARLIAAHPKIAGQLRACLQVMNLADRMVDASSSASGMRRPIARLDSTAMDPGRSGLTTLGSSSFPNVQLRDLPDESEPLIQPRSTEMPVPNGTSLGRYQLQGEIARGGMGAILKGRDVELGRDLAIKVLLEAHQDNAEIVNRFIEEAQISGQLQHPGITPVYELGTFPDPDRRPYFAMKLVRGQTLGALLAERKDRAGRGSPDPALASSGVLPSSLDDLHRFLAIFEQVCQTMAYAHARGVIHRDLKPSNVMVGSFGEVQVMDWGLAKVLPRGGIADEGGAYRVQETVVMTVRSGVGGSSAESQAGSVLGTPAYMAPEQGRGEMDRVDERADVFGLGAILCEILTGRPPFIGTTREDIRHKAARGDLTDALRRLDASMVGADLVELAQRCLASEPDERPRNAGEVTRRLSAYLAGVQERLRTAELARVAAQARAAEERKRRRLSAALSASLLVTAAVIAGGWTYLERKRTERQLTATRLVNDALSTSAQLLGQARSAPPGDLTNWSSAMAAAARARDLSEQGEPDADLRARVQDMIAVVESEQTEARMRVAALERDRKLLADLEAIRGGLSEHWKAARTSDEYAASFRNFGVDVDQLEPVEAGKQIAQRTAPVELASYIDDWALRRRKSGDKDPTSWTRLLAAASIADPDPWRVKVRELIGSGDRESLRRIAADEKGLATQPVSSMLLLAEALIAASESTSSGIVLHQAWQLAPGDFWVNFLLGAHYLRKEVKLDEAARFFSVCVAIRPRSAAAHNMLANTRNNQGRLDESVSEYRASVRLQPEESRVRCNLALALQHQGKLDLALAELREAAKTVPNDARSRFVLGDILREMGDFEQAIAEYRNALRISPNDEAVLLNLAIALHQNREWQGESAIYEELLRRHPDNTLAYANYGVLHRRRGQFVEAIADFRRARDLARKEPALAAKFQQELTATEHLAVAAERLPPVLSGKLQPRDVAEIKMLADVSYLTQQHSNSAKLWARAFHEQPAFADDMRAQNRYNAACAAALAASGQGKDDPPLDDGKKAHWRKQAIAWLKADLAAWSKLLANGPPQAKQSIAQTLQHWKADIDLAGLRDAAALAKLSDDEEKAWRALWAEVDALVAKAQAAKQR